MRRAAPIPLSPAAAHALWAESYDREANPLLALEERIVRPLLPGLKGRTILDAACGTGRWLGHLGEAGARMLLGVDLSPEMLRRAAGQPLLRGRLVRGDCLELPLRAAAVDLALCSFAVGYLGDLPRFARELARTVKAGGHLLLTDFHPSARERGWKRSFRHASGVIEIASFDYPLDVVSSAFTAAGFDESARIESGFGEPERPVFERGGKGHLFVELGRGPAIFVLRFRRSPRPPHWPH